MLFLLIYSLSKFFLDRSESTSFYQRVIYSMSNKFYFNDILIFFIKCRKVKSMQIARIIVWYMIMLKDAVTNISLRRYWQMWLR